MALAATAILVEHWHQREDGAVTTRREIDEFWGLRRIAVVGVSRDPRRFSHMIWQELRQVALRGSAGEPGDRPPRRPAVLRRVRDILPPMEGVPVMTPPHVTDQVVRDCAEAA
jgi:predicted CoA-binding protein